MLFAIVDADEERSGAPWSIRLSELDSTAPIYSAALNYDYESIALVALALTSTHTHT